MLSERMIAHKTSGGSKAKGTQVPVTTPGIWLCCANATFHQRQSVPAKAVIRDSPL